MEEKKQRQDKKKTTSQDDKKRRDKVEENEKLSLRKRNKGSVGRKKRIHDEGKGLTTKQEERKVKVKGIQEWEYRNGEKKKQQGRKEEKTKRRRRRQRERNEAEERRSITPPWLKRLKKARRIMTINLP